MKCPGNNGMLAMVRDLWKTHSTVTPKKSLLNNPVPLSVSSTPDWLLANRERWRWWMSPQWWQYRGRVSCGLEKKSPCCGKAWEGPPARTCRAAPSGQPARKPGLHPTATPSPMQPTTLWAWKRAPRSRKKCSPLTAWFQPRETLSTGHR